MGRPRRGRIASSSSISSSVTASVEPGGPPSRQTQPFDRGATCAQEDGVGNEHHQDQGEPCPGRDDSGHGQETDRRDHQRDGSAEDDDLPVEPDPTGHHGSQAEQGGQVEDIRADRHAGPDGTLMMGQGGHRSRDLGRVGGQGGHQAEQRLGQTETLADPLEAGHEHPTGEPERPPAPNTKAAIEDPAVIAARTIFGRSSDQLRPEAAPVAWQERFLVAHVGSSARTNTVPTRLPGSPGMRLPAPQVCGHERILATCA